MLNCHVLRDLLNRFSDKSSSVVGARFPNKQYPWVFCRNAFICEALPHSARSEAVMTNPTLSKENSQMSSFSFGYWFYYYFT